MVKKEYKECVLCPNRCRVDRSRSYGVCHQSDKVKIAWSGLHRGEEPPVTGEYGSGMIFFTGCPLHCNYCQNIQISGARGENWGIEVTIEELAELMLGLERMKATTLNLVTGTHFIPSIIDALDIARSKGLTIPMVWNSSGYESIEGLELIDKYVDLYLLDCKSIKRKVCSVFAGRSGYADAIRPVMDYIKEKHPTTDLDNLKGTLLRHLVFPGAINATKDFLRLFAREYKNSFVLSLMTQFVPPKENPGFLPISDSEYDELVELLEELEIDDGFMQERSDNEILWIPDFREDVPFPPSFADPNPYFLELKRKRVGSISR